MAHSRICSVDGCGKPHRTKGWCVNHYWRFRFYGDPLGGGPDKLRQPPVCTIEGCSKKSYAHGLCSAHNYRRRKHGDPLGGGTGDGEPLRYFREVVMAYEGDECLAWPYGKNASGYGVWTGATGSGIVSRQVCEEAHGPAPTPKHEAAHSCGKGHLACVTKGHLSWKTPKENGADKRLHRRRATVSTRTASGQYGCG